MNALQRPGRAAATVGAAVAVGAATLAVIAGTATAAEPGRCVDNVNVRSAPSMTAEILSVCEAGTPVQVGETRNGFVRLVDLGGWSSAEFVSVDGATPATAPAATDREEQTTRSTSPARDEDATGTDATSGTSRSGDAAERTGTDRQDATGQDEPRTRPFAPGSSSDDEAQGSDAADEEQAEEAGSGGPLGALPLP